MGKEILTFGNIEIEKNKFYRYKTPVFLKRFPLVNDIHKVKPLHITLPKTTVYV